eukprot:4384243-Pyramimonas_sp.AAC.1
MSMADQQCTPKPLTPARRRRMHAITPGLGHEEKPSDAKRADARDTASQITRGAATSRGGPCRAHTHTHTRGAKRSRNES